MPSAAPIGVDRAVERQVLRLVVGDDAARGINADRGPQGRQILVEDAPTIVHFNRRIARRPPALAGLSGKIVHHGDRVLQE